MVLELALRLITLVDKCVREQTLNTYRPKHITNQLNELSFNFLSRGILFLEISLFQPDYQR